MLSCKGLLLCHWDLGDARLGVAIAPQGVCFGIAAALEEAKGILHVRIGVIAKVREERLYS